MNGAPHCARPRIDHHRLAASVGFTFTLFLATTLYPAGPLLAELKLGALLTGLGALLALAAARLLHVGPVCHATCARPPRRIAAKRKEGTMTTILIAVPFALLPLLHLPAPTGHCQLEVLTSMAMEERALAQFNARIDQYAALHRGLERSFPHERLFDDAEDMFAAREALHSAIARARTDARQGDVFAPAMAQLVIDRLGRVIREHRLDPADILDDINAERLPGMPEPEVNGDYPWGIGSAMWPMLLRALPPLPRELEYRFSNRDLVLIDVHANLVVDILDNALPPAACSDAR